MTTSFVKIYNLEVAELKLRNNNNSANIVSTGVASFVSDVFGYIKNIYKITQLIYHQICEPIYYL